MYRLHIERKIPVSTRPYSQKSLDQLRDLAREEWGSIGELRLLLNELEFRESVGAANLGRLLRTRVNELQRSNPIDRLRHLAQLRPQDVENQDSSELPRRTEPLVAKRARKMMPASGGLPEAQDHSQFFLESLDQARARLLDKTKRNRLLNYRESARDIAIIREYPDFVFRDLVEEGKSYRFQPKVEVEEEDELQPVLEVDYEDDELPLDPTDVDPDTTNVTDNLLQTPYDERSLERKLRNLYRLHRTHIEETGANNLYLAMGFLMWREDESEIPTKSPLMLLPVRIERKSGYGQTTYELRFDDEALDTNYALVEKLKLAFDYVLPRLEEEMRPEAYWEQVRDSIPHRLEDQWEVRREMALGMFRFSKQVMWHDLDPSRWPDHSRLTEQGILKRVFVGAGSDQEPPGQITVDHPDQPAHAANAIKLISDADASQYSALLDALSASEGIVIEGPPGTGKSQTISNLIAAAMDQGLRVLFVAEKMAALEVVHKRLSDAGLGEFCLQLHGLRGSKKDLMEDLKSRLSLQATEPTTTDGVIAEHEQRRTELLDLTQILAKRVGPEQVPLHELFWQIEVRRSSLPSDYEAPVAETRQGVPQEFRKLRGIAQQLSHQWADIPLGTRRAWSGWVPRSLDDRSRPRIESELRDCIDEISQFRTWLKKKPALESEILPQLLQHAVSAGKSEPGSLLPQFPDQGHPGLVVRALRAEQSQDLVELLKKALDYLSGVSQINLFFDYASKNSQSWIERLARLKSDVSGKLCRPETELGALSEEQLAFQAVIAALEKIEKSSKPILGLKDQICRTIDDYEELATWAEAISRGPDELVLFAHPGHAETNARTLLNLAKKEAQEILSAMDENRVFRHRATTDRERLAAAIDYFEPRVSSLAPWLKLEYWKQRSYVRSLMSDPKAFKRGPELLDQLVFYRECLDRQIEFASIDKFKTVLGGRFKGVETDWTVLDSLIGHADNLVEMIGVEEAKGVLANWDGHVDQITGSRESIVDSIRCCRQFAEAHPIAENLWTRPISHLQTEVAKLKDRLDENVELVLGEGWCSPRLRLSQIAELISKFDRTKSLEVEIERRGNLLSPVWERALTQSETLECTVDWLEERLSSALTDQSLLAALTQGEAGFDYDLANRLEAGSTTLAAAHSKLVRLLLEIGDLSTNVWDGGEGSTIWTFQQKLEDCLSRTEHLPALVQCYDLFAMLEAGGLESLGRDVLEGRLAEEEPVKAFELAVFKMIADEEILEDERLRHYSNSQIEDLRSRFVDLDRQLLKLNGKIIRAKLCQRRIPPGNSTG